MGILSYALLVTATFPFINLKQVEVLAHMGYELQCLTVFLLVSALKFHCKSIREKTDCAACYHIAFSLLLC